MAFTYTQTAWSETVAITPERLNNIENGIASAGQYATWTNVSEKDLAKQDIRLDGTVGFAVERRTDNPVSPEAGRMWLIDDTTTTTT